MNKKSIFLFFGIFMMLGISAMTVYGAWIKPSTAETQAEQAAVAAVQEEMELSNIAMNDQAQVINGGSNKMWIRAKVEIPPIYGEPAFFLQSDYITEQPDEQKGVWYLADDGYYYYGEPVNPGEQSNSLFYKMDPLLENDSLMPDESTVHVVAEGIQINWLRHAAENGLEAFGLFQQYGPVKEIRQMGKQA